jgi:hypothetical protein
VAPAVPLPVVPAFTIWLKCEAARVAEKVAPEATVMAVLPREAVWEAAVVSARVPALTAVAPV